MPDEQSSKESSRKRKSPPPDPVPGVSIEYLINQLHQYANHLWVSKEEEAGSPKGRAYRIAIENIQTAILWLETTK